MKAEIILAANTVAKAITVGTQSMAGSLERASSSLNSIAGAMLHISKDVATIRSLAQDYFEGRAGEDALKQGVTAGTSLTDQEINLYLGYVKDVWEHEAVPMAPALWRQMGGPTSYQD